jgi:uracil-DNA glycosylase
VVDAAKRLELVAAEAASCRDCDLWRRGTQTVFGEGPADARVVMVGEQPGDQEDLEGAPFVGPAGRLLDDAMVEAGLERSEVYVTNAVKHFKWEPRGKRRIHQRPNRTEVVACHQWLEQELAIFDPASVVVALGAIAGQALFGPTFRVGESRGAELQLDEHPVVATVHPSSVLRARGTEERASAYAGLVEDLVRVRALAS